MVLALLALMTAWLSPYVTKLWTKPAVASAGLTHSALATSAPPQREAALASPEIVLRMCGSNTVGAELAPALVEAFLATRGGTDVTRQRESEVTQVQATLDHRRVGVEIRAKGTATAFSGLAQGACDIGMASRAIEDAEALQWLERGVGDLRAPGSEHVIALDGVAVIVHPNNRLRSLDRATLADIFTGKVSDWASVGGEAGAMHVYARDDNSGTFDTFKHLILGKAALVSDARRYAQNDLLADAVAADPAGIGFVGLAYVRAARALAVGEPNTTPMLPTQFTVATEDYLLSRRLYFYTLPSPRTPWVTELVSFALSHRADRIAAEHQFVDLAVLTSPSPCEGHCPKRYQDLSSHAERMSLSFRFRQSSDELDSRAGRDLDRIAGFLHEQRQAKLLLFGFSDSMGSAGANMKISLERAKTIERELSLRGVHPSVVTGFGSALAVASNQTESGRQRNRRVEAWIERVGVP
jgi:phosphate transport system substrate-binding protein